MRPILVLLLIAACPAFGGCDGDDEGRAGAPAKAPAPDRESTQDIDVFGQLVETALTRPDCEGLKTKVNKPEEGGIEIACPARVAEVGAAYAGYRTTGAKSYGTGAVIDYKAAEAPNGGTWELSLGADGTWVIDAGRITAQKTSASDLVRHGAFDRVLDRFLEAVRDSDCDAFFKSSETTARDKWTACERELPFYDALGTALAASPDAQPVFLGGNRTYAFYGLETAKPKPAYRTVTVARAAEGSAEPYLVARTKLGPEP